MILKRNLTLIGILSVVFLSTTLIFQSCKKSHSDIGAAVFKETKNKVFKDIETDTFVQKFRLAFEKQEATFKNPRFLRSIYEDADFEPILVMKNLPQGRLKEALAVVNKSADHGLDSSIFKVTTLNELINKVYDKKQLTSVQDAYQTLIDLELAAANTLSNYSSALQFGVISPRKIYAQYYTATKRPDSASFLQVFQTDNIKQYLDSIQPIDKQYIALQNALKDKLQVVGVDQQETERVLKVNLERLRWKNLPTENKYVWVNIPDFRLDVIEGGESFLNMKVCVGEGRNHDGKDQLVEYDENDLKKDRPFNRETPQLKSLIHSVQVNPIWNIPESIATNEITKYAANDPHYLANNNIDVFLNGKKIEDPETIDWTTAGAGKAYSFKQRPGDDNSLGKIKFLFDNESSVYLHDTPNKSAFNQDMRAISHGCVRVEKPLELAEALFGTGAKYDKIKEGMVSKNPKATDIALPKQVPVYLSYFTCWVDETGKLQLRKDIYGLDIVLYTYMQRVT